MASLRGALLLVAICGCPIVAMLLVDRVLLADPKFEFGDRVIFFAEVILAAYLAAIVFLYSQKNDRSIRGHLAKVWSMLERNEKAKQAKKLRKSRALCSDMNAVKSDCLTLVEAGSKSTETHPNQWPQFWDGLVSLDDRIKASVGRVRRDLDGMDYIDDYTYDAITEAVDQLGDAIHVDEDGRTVDTGRYQRAADMLGPVLLRLDRRLNAAPHATSPLFPTAAASGSSGPFEIRLDQALYPPNATVRASVAFDGPFPGKKVTVAILDENLATLAKTTERAPVPETGQPGPNVTVVDVRPSGMAVGKEYIAQAVCGGLAAEAVFAVDEIPPDIETDKSIYLMDSDILVTVMDPTADTSSSKKGHVGYTKKSRLVIESPHGRIGKYQLEETEPSSGVFQGTIRCAAVRNDGSVRRTLLGGTHVAKAGGKGPEDGVIPCGPSQLIHIKYANESGTAATSVIVGGFGSVLELNRDEYTCLDRVKIGVISPDLAPDGGSGRPATIGDDRRDCWLTVSTGEGSLEGYRLVEAGQGNGKFMGTVSLTGVAGMGDKKNSNDLEHGRTGGSGPHDGALACGPYDELKVSFASAFGGPVIQAAPIRWHIGEIRFSKAAYLPGEEVTVRVTDRDMSLNDDRPDLSQVRAWSHSDREGIRVPIRETGCESGIFEGQFTTSEDRSLPEQLVLKANDGDVVFAEYIDETLPHPYACNDSIAINSAASITTSKKKASPLARLVVDDMRITNKKTGGALVAGDNAEVAIRVKNPEREIHFTAILQVSDLEGVTMELQDQPLTAGLGGYATHTFSWTPRWPGACVATVFLWKSLDDPIAYSPPASREVQVLDPPGGNTLPENGADGRMPADGDAGSAGGGPTPDGGEGGHTHLSRGPAQGGRGS